MPRIDLADVAAWLHLAATPSFTAMAVLTAMLGAGPDMICGQDASLLGGMVPMYLLMSMFHLPPWLKLVASRRLGPLSRAAVISRSDGALDRA
jgi:hypothetical protein